MVNLAQHQNNCNTGELLHTRVQRVVFSVVVIPVLLFALIAPSVGAQQVLQDKQYNGAILNLHDFSRINLRIQKPTMSEANLDEIVAAMSQAVAELEKEVEIHVNSACFANDNASSRFKKIAVRLSCLSEKFSSVSVAIEPNIESLQRMSSTVGQWKGAHYVTVSTDPYGTLMADDELAAADEAIAELYRQLPNLKKVHFPEFAGQKAFDAVCLTANPRALFLNNVSTPLDLTKMTSVSNLKTIYLPPVHDLSAPVALIMKTKIDQVSLSEVDAAAIESISRLKQLRVLIINTPMVRTFEKLKELDQLVRFEVQIPGKDPEDLRDHQKLWEEVAKSFPNGLEGGVTNGLGSGVRIN